MNEYILPKGSPYVSYGKEYTTTKELSTHAKTFERGVVNLTFQLKKLLNMASNSNVVIDEDFITILTDWGDPDNQPVTSSVNEDLDTNGHELSPKQAEFFSGSRVRNDFGDLLVCYRGTIDADILDGSIIWFTSEKAYAHRYADVWRERGKVLKCYLNCKKIFDIGITDGRLWDLNPISNSFSKQFLKVLSRLDISEELFKKNFEKELKDLDYRAKIFEIVNTSKFADLIKRSGYDCIRTIEESENICYGVLNKKAIKSVLNLTPTASVGINESIRSN